MVETNTPRSRRGALVAVSLAVCLSASGAHAGGFQIFEQGARALGSANAVAASVDDPSAMYYNVGGLAFLNDERRFMIGGTVIQLGDSDFEGRDPFPGDGVTAEQATNFVVPPHFYWVEPIRENLVFGLGVESPFGLITEWEDEDDFAGRFVSTRAELIVLDLNPSVAFLPKKNFGIGVGLIVRTSTVELDRRVAVVNPFSQAAAEVADLNLEADPDVGFGFNFGIQHRLNEWFSWGASYRSEIEVEYGGDARFEQILTGDPVFDFLVPTLIPFGSDRPIETEIAFPAQAALGLAFQATTNMVFETDINWTGWNSFDTTELLFTDPADAAFTSTIESNWNDAYTFRAGFAISQGTRNTWRAGYYFDESPQPDEGVGPLLPDADRNGLTFGFGRKGESLEWDVSALWLPFERRTTLTNSDGLNGTYETQTLLVSGSVLW